MWITMRRSAARPKPPVELESLEARFLLATTTTSQASDAATTDQIAPAATAVTTPTAATAATSRIDTYDLPAGAGYPALKVQILWSAADPTQGTLVLLGPGATDQAQWPFDARAKLQASPTFSIAADDGLVRFARLDITLEVDPATSTGADAGASAGTYNLSVSWGAPSVASPQMVAQVLPPPVTVAAGQTAPAGASGSPPGLPSSMTGTPGSSSPSPSPITNAPDSSNPTATLPPSLSIQGKPLPAPSDVTFAPKAPQDSGGSTSPPPATISVAGSSVVSLLPPGGSIVNWVPIGPLGPNLPVGPAGGVTGVPALEARGEFRPLGPSGDGSGPSLIVGPLPPGRSDPDGGIFARSFASTVGTAGTTGTETSTSLVIPSGVGQGGPDAPRWPSLLDRSALDDWLTPFGLDREPLGDPIPSPLAATPAGARSDEAVLLPVLAMGEASTIPPTEGSASSVLGVGSEATDRASGPALPALAPPGSAVEGEADRTRGWPRGWSAVMVMALAGSAVMIFRLHGAGPDDEDLD